jgi:hypothetical protein
MKRPGRSREAKHDEFPPMPTVLQDGPYSFVFFSSDKGEPPHIHVKKDQCVVKFWLDPVVLAKNRGFQGHELNTIARLVKKHESVLREAWHEYFGA